MNHFTVKATQRARQFFRRPAPGYLTGSGNLNAIEEITPSTLRFKTTVGRVNQVSKAAIIKAAAFLLERRSVTRKELEKFSPFSSAMLGLLRSIFGNIAKIRITKTGLLRLSLKGTRFIFSGVDRAFRDMRVAKENGAEVVMMTYYHIRDDKTDRWKYHIKENGLKVLLDSGAFSLWKALKNGKAADPIHLTEYVAFIQRHQDVLIGYFNLDVIGDPDGSRRNIEVMEAAGLSPIEVWHVSSPIEELDRIVSKGAALVGIGGAAELVDEERLAVFTEVLRRHPDQDFHLLGVGSKILFNLSGLFSADSSNWTQGRRSGRILEDTGQKHINGTMTGLEAMAYNVRKLSSLILY